MKVRLGVVLLLLVLDPQSGAAQVYDNDTFSLVSDEDESASRGDLQQQINDLRRKVEKLDKNPAALSGTEAGSGSGTVHPLTFQRFSGMGAVASKVYFHPSPLVIGLSADLITFTEHRGTDFEGAANVNLSDVAKISPHLGYRFSPHILFNSRFTFQSGGAESHSGGAARQTGQSIVEFAYLDFQLGTDHGIGIRLGHQLIPAGWTNLLQEPIYYYGVSRPEVETHLIPSSWHENGVLLWGGFHFLHAKLGVFNSLDGNEFTAEDYLRPGRQNGQQALSEDIMGTARLDFKLPTFTLGASYNTGPTNQGDKSLGRARLNLWETHIKWQWQFMDFTALYTESRLSDTEAILLANDLDAPPAALANGYYVTLAVDFLGAVNRDSEASLPIFVRYSDYNLHKEIISGYTPDPSLHRKITTVGVNFRPNPHVVLKMNYQMRKTAAREKTDLIEFGAGLVF